MGSIPDLDLSAQQQATAQRNLADDLAQVEAAMAALEGRDPTRGIEVAHARRDAERVRGQLRSVVEQGEIQVAKNESRRKWIAFGGALAAVLVVAGGATAFMLFKEKASETSAVEDAGRKVAQPFLDAGFAREHSSISKPITVAGASKCFVAVAATKGSVAKVRVERGPDRVEAQSAAFCLCGEATATVTPIGQGDVALEVVEIGAGKIGGADLLPSLKPKVEAVLGETDDRACAEWAVDAFVDASAPSTGEAPTEIGKKLVLAGLSPLSSAAGTEPFLRVVSPPDACVVAIGNAAGDKLSLRLRGGARPLGVETDVVALCDTQIDTSSVWRTGTGRIDAFSASIEAIGGSLGLSELLRRAGFDRVGIQRSASAIAAEPRALLFASGASAAHLVEADGTSLLGAADAPYLFAFAAADGRTAPPISPANATCSPPLSTSPAAAVCLGDRTLFEDKRGQSASRPEWLRIGHEPASIEAGLALMALARRLHAWGLVPTPPLGATLTASGADVVGRPNESTMVGIVIADVPPFLHTLSDGAPWSLEGEPRVVPIAPGAKVSLVATPKLPASRGRASIVLFRK